MADMTISEFYDELLSDKEFQNPETGKLFFPTYIFTYNHEKEYEIRKEIDGLKDRLERPSNFIDTLILNIFDEFIDFLKEDKLKKVIAAIRNQVLKGIYSYLSFSRLR